MQSFLVASERYVAFAHRFSELVISLVRYFLAGAQKTHQNLNVVFSKDLLHVPDSSAIGGMTQDRYTAPLLFCQCGIVECQIHFIPRHREFPQFEFLGKGCQSTAMSNMQMLPQIVLITVFTSRRFLIDAGAKIAVSKSTVPGRQSNAGLDIGVNSFRASRNQR